MPEDIFFEECELELGEFVRGRERALDLFREDIAIEVLRRDCGGHRFAQVVATIHVHLRHLTVTREITNMAVNKQQFLMKQRTSFSRFNCFQFFGKTFYAALLLYLE